MLQGGSSGVGIRVLSFSPRHLLCKLTAGLLNGEASGFMTCYQAFMLQESSPRVDKGEVQCLLVHAGGSISLPCLAGYNGRIAG